MRCCVEDEGNWPLEVALRGEASNHRVLRRLNAVRGERRGKGVPLSASGGDREGERKLFAVEVSKAVLVGIETGARTRSQDEPGGSPLTGQAVPGI
jgi:hypothetical protein